MRSALMFRMHRRGGVSRTARKSTQTPATQVVSSPFPLCRHHHRRSTSTSTSTAATADSNDDDNSSDQQPPPPPLTIIPEAPPAALDVEAEALAPELLLNAAGDGVEEGAAAFEAAVASSASAASLSLLSSNSGSSAAAAAAATAAFAVPSETAAALPPSPPPSPPRPPPRDPLRALRSLASLLSPDKGAPAPSSSSTSSPNASASSTSVSASASRPPTSFSPSMLSTDSDDEGFAASAAATAAAAAAAAAALATATDDDAAAPPPFAPVDFEAAAAFGGVVELIGEGSTSSSSSPPSPAADSLASLPLAAAVATPPPIAETPDVPAVTASAAVLSKSGSSSPSSSSSSAAVSSSSGATRSVKGIHKNDNDSNDPNSNDDSSDSPDLGNIWGLGVLGLLYVHHSTTGFALPALLPLISPDLSLTDVQGSLLTAGYTVLYALALIPVGFLADRADRPRMLAGGAVLWSLATIAASRAQGFGELLALRVGFAAAQATQNPICFSLIPELFPRERNTAMAAYNAAIYVGRALSFAAVIVAGRLGMGNVSANAVSAAAEGGAAASAAASAAGDVAGSVIRDIGVTMVPLDKLDLSQVSLLYTQGNMAAITPIYDYDFTILHNVVTEASWRQLLFWLGPPGLVVAALALLTLDEPRAPGSAPSGDPFASSKFINPATRAMSRSRGDRFVEKGAEAWAKSGRKLIGGASVSVAPAAAAALPSSSLSLSSSSTDPKPSVWESVKALCSSRAFQAITAAAAINDVGSWSLVAFQATFYQRVYDLGPETYAPALAIILPIGGILGGVGGGLLADGLSRSGGRYLLTSGATLIAAPVLAFNVLAPDHRASFAALLVGFGLSEMWRAPAAVMVRDVSPPDLGSTGSAVHLCVRNLVGGLGPLAVALLQEKVGLQTAMLLVPFCYAGSGVAFFFAEKVLAAEKAEAREAAAKQERRELKKVRKEGAAAAAIVAGRKEG